MMRNIFLSPDPIRNSYTMQRHLPLPSHFSFFSIWHFVIKLSRIDLYFNVSITNLYTFKGVFRGYKWSISWESPEWSLVKSLAIVGLLLTVSRDNIVANNLKLWILTVIVKPQTILMGHLSLHFNEFDFSKIKIWSFYSRFFITLKIDT